MKKFVSLLCAMVLVLSFSGMASALVYTFQPNDGGGDSDDLWDLEHGRYYSWGVDWAVPTGEKIVGAKLFFDDIKNWQTEDNDLFVHLLDSVTTGAHQYTDPQSGQIDFFAGQGVLLKQWHNLPSTPIDITYDFDAAELAALVNYAADGNFGFGFDPDCHFYNNGISLIIETAADAVPEPATMVLLGIGILSIVAIKRKRGSK